MGGTAGNAKGGTGGAESAGGTTSVGGSSAAGGSMSAGGTAGSAGTSVSIGGEGGEAGEVSGAAGVAGEAGEAGEAGSGASVGAGGTSNAGGGSGGASGQGGSGTGGAIGGSAGVAGSATGASGGTVGASGGGGVTGVAGMDGGVAGTGGGVAGTGGTDACSGVTCNGHGVCSALSGSAVCSCDSGFVNGADAATCLDLNECTANNGGCDSLTTCTNSVGGFACGACPPGYDGTGATGCVPRACSGAPDPTCACIHVAPDGDDTAGAATGGVAPFASVQTAIDFAASHRTHATTVCLAEGALCGTSASYAGPSGADLTMRDGISVYGQYESTSWTQCSSGSTALLPSTPTGVLFDTSILEPTVLGGVVVERFASATTTGISVLGAQNVLVSGVLVGGGAGAANLFGVDLAGGAEARLSVEIFDPNAADAGWSPSGSNIGVRAVGATAAVSGASLYLVSGGNGTGVGVWLEDAPGSSVQGTTIDLQATLEEIPASLTGIHAVRSGPTLALDGNQIRVVSSPGTATAATGVEVMDSGVASLGSTPVSVGPAQTMNGVHTTRTAVTSTGSIALSALASPSSGVRGVWLDDSPGSAIVGPVTVTQGYGVEGIHVVGDATGDELTGPVTITTPDTGGDATPNIGISLQECADSAPFIGSSVVVTLGVGSWTATGIAAGCPAVISNTVAMNGSSPRWSQNLTGIACSGACEIRDTSVGLKLAADQIFNPPPMPPGAEIDWTGIGCSPGCGAITGSNIQGLSGISEQQFSAFHGNAVTAGSTPLVSRNHIAANCGGPEGYALSASGRVENNVIQGPTCGFSLRGIASNVTTLTTNSYGLLASGADVHSNSIDGGGVCDFPPHDPTNPLDHYFDTRPHSCTSIAVQGTGTLRNDWLEGTIALSVPLNSTIEHNNLLGNIVKTPGFMGSPPQFMSIAELETTDPAASGNFKGFSSTDGVDAGTRTGAPAADIDGTLRDAYPDVGPYEMTGAPSACFGVDCNHGVCLNGACQCDPAFTGTQCDVPNGP